MPVYKQYSQEELDLQYNNRYHVPDFEKSLASWETLSRQAEKKYRVIKDIPYGSVSRESLDVFPSPQPGAKTLIFIHGGYWQMFDKSSFYFVASAFAEYGITTVLVNYPLAPANNMDEVVASCRKALGWVHENLEKWNGDPSQIYLAGHSAGGHLATMLITTDEGQNNQHYLKGACAISGVFNLTPIQHSRLNGVLQMDTPTANRNSPVLLTPSERFPLIIAVGSEETNEFKNQSRELYHHWRNKNISIDLLEIPGLNHFTILDSLCDEDSLLHRALCRLMKINSSVSE